MIVINIIILYLLIGLFIQYITKQKPSVLACGMVGFSGPENFNPDFIKILLLSNVVRGVHSTGIYNNGTVTKQAINAIEFLGKEPLIPERLFMGHDRHATIGNKTDSDNAHPFFIGGTVGQHNGTLKNHWDLAKGLGLEYKDWDVDSQVLIHGLDASRKSFKILYEFEGAAAIIWTYLDTPERLYCFRNSERPLFRGMVGENMYISSIEDSLNIIGCKNVKSFKENYVYAIEDGKILKQHSKRIVRKVVKKTKVVQKNAFQHKNTSVDRYLGASKKGDEPKQDIMCHWVKRLSITTVDKSFIQGKWYFVGSEHNDRQLWIKNEQGRNVIADKIHFSQYSPLVPGTHVIVPEGDGKIFQTGEVLFLRGLDMDKSETVTIAVLEKLTASDKSYTWDQTMIRTAEPREIDDYVFESAEDNDINKAERPDDQALSSQEELYHKFENSNLNMDYDGNRLGNIWIEIGDLYENVIQLRSDIEDMNVELSNILKEYSAMPQYIRNRLSSHAKAIEDAESDTEDIVNDMFFKAFEMDDNSFTIDEDGKEKSSDEEEEDD